MRWARIYTQTFYSEGEGRLDEFEASDRNDAEVQTRKWLEAMDFDELRTIGQVAVVQIADRIDVDPLQHWDAARARPKS